MFTNQSYREVLSEHDHRGHIIGSGWLVVAALGIMVVLFA